MRPCDDDSADANRETAGAHRSLRVDRCVPASDAALNTLQGLDVMLLIRASKGAEEFEARKDLQAVYSAFNISCPKCSQNRDTNPRGLRTMATIFAT